MLLRALLALLLAAPAAVHANQRGAAGQAKSAPSGFAGGPAVVVVPALVVPVGLDLPGSGGVRSFESRTSVAPLVGAVSSMHGQEPQALLGAAPLAGTSALERAAARFAEPGEQPSAAGSSQPLPDLPADEQADDGESASAQAGRPFGEAVRRPSEPTPVLPHAGEQKTGSGGPGLEPPSPRRRLLRGLPLVTSTIILANTAAYASVGASDPRFALKIDAVRQALAHGTFGEARAQLSTVATSTFIHGGVGHLFGNMAALLMYGIFVERWLGGRRLSLIYMAAAAASGASALAFLPSGSAVVGASGAVAGILAAYLATVAFAWRGRKRPQAMGHANAFLFFFGLLTVFQDALSLVYGIADNVFNLGHVSGYAVGFIAAWLISRRVSRA